MSDNMWMVVGLGNPGSEYEKTRHNIGAMVLDVLSQRMGGKLTRNKKAAALTLEGRLNNQRLILVFPTTYMNRSGDAVSPLLKFYKIPIENVIVLHDELDIPFEAIRLKLGGGDNGHNGLKSIRASLGTGEWLRVRLGIGRPPGSQDPAAFVLKAFSSIEASTVALFTARAADAVESLMSEGLAQSQSRYNQ
jgi:PTH1 family peptidyl-tRNA hydrolase